MDILIQHQSHHKQNPFLGRLQMQKGMHSVDNQGFGSLSSLSIEWHLLLNTRGQENKSVKGTIYWADSLWWFLDEYQYLHPAKQYGTYTVYINTESNKPP